MGYRQYRSRVIAIAVFLFGGLPAISSAIDGQVLINQSRALAGGVTPGDAPGFPVTISLPGSYRLSGDLTVPDVDISGIVITANNVTLDLNGFAIKGPTVCTSAALDGPVTSCSPGNNAGAGVEAVLSGPATGITVSNGTVRGFYYGIYLGAGGRVEKVLAEHNTGNGITVLQAAHLHANVAGRNLGTGIYAGSGSVVTENTAYRNGTGFLAVVSTLLSNNARKNAFAGIFFAPEAGSSGKSGWGNNVLTDNANQTYTQAPGGGIQLGSNVCNDVLCP
jgi:hypothetical protein